MRLLFFVEPAVFREDPHFLAPHLEWVAGLVRTSSAGSACFALASSPALCGALAEQAPDVGPRVAKYPLDSFGATASSGYRRLGYASALYGDGHGPCALKSTLETVRREFAPDCVVLTSQNAIAEQAFAGLPMLRMEQAPLPRAGHPLRFCLDPCGHQVGSVLEVQAQAIRNLSLDPAVRAGLTRLLHDVRQRAATADERSVRALAELATLRQHGRLALLAMQPPDWITYEGALYPIEPEGLLMSWADSLPQGWVGVPTYHPTWRLPRPMECVLADSTDRLRFLPGDLAQGTTEALLTLADGFVTISSSAAMTALLFGKHAVVTGKSPYASWCPREVIALKDSATFSEQEATSVLAFLCNRYVHRADRLFTEPGYLESLLSALYSSGDPAASLLNLDVLSIEGSRALFALGD